MNFPLHSGLFKGHNLHTLTVFTASHIAARSSHNFEASSLSLPLAQFYCDALAPGTTVAAAPWEISFHKRLSHLNKTLF